MLQESGLTKLQELKTQEEILLDTIDNHPAKGFQKYYGNKSMDDYTLGEILATAEGTDKKSARLDSIVSEAGYEDINAAQEGLDELRDLRAQLKDLRGEIKVERANPTRSVLRKTEEGSEEGLAQGPNVYEPIARTPQQLESETLDTQTGQALEGSGVSKEAKSLRDMVTRGPDVSVKSKVNALDYMRTPDRVLRKIGLGDEAIQIRRAYDKYLEELPKNIDKITAWADRAKTKGSAKRIFDYLDGEPDESGYVVKLDDPEEMKIAQEIKVWLKEWADRMGLPNDRRISMYITHIFEKDFIKKEFDPDLAKIIQDKVPGSVYNPFLEERLGAKGYVQDAWRALDAYAKRATRKVHMDPALEHLKIASEDLPIESFNYVKKYADRVNLRPTEWDNLIDNFLKSVPGVEYKFGQRPLASISRTGRRMIYRGTLGLNFGSALRNLSQGANTYAKLGEKYTIIGYSKLLTHWNDPELEAVLGNDLVQDRVISATGKFWQNTDDNLFMFFDAAEKVNRGAAYFGAKAKAIKAGKSEEEAIQAGRDMVRDTQFTFGSVDTPVSMQSDIAKLLTQFQSYSVKQAEFLAEMVQNKEWAGLIRYALAGFAMLMTIGKLWGMKPTDLIPSFRFSSVPPFFGPAVETFKAVTGMPDTYGNVPKVEKRIEKVGKSFLPFIPAGTQMKKFYEGWQAGQEGVSTGTAGQIQYTFATTLTNKARAMIFGKSTLPEAKAYFDSDTPLKAAEENIKPTYVAVQQLIADGAEEEAQAIVDGLSDDDYEAYKALRAKDKRSDTVKREAKLIGTVRKVQELVADGKAEEAQAIVDALSDEDYNAYTLAKKRLDIK